MTGVGYQSGRVDGVPRGGYQGCIPRDVYPAYTPGRYIQPGIHQVGTYSPVYTQEGLVYPHIHPGRASIPAYTPPVGPERYIHHPWV